MVIQAKILNVGVDTLKVNVKLADQPQALPVDLEVYCSLWQQQVREMSKPIATTITFHNERMTMLLNGAPGCSPAVPSPPVGVVLLSMSRVL